MSRPSKDPKCNKCNEISVYVDNVPGKEYYYCRPCKVEVDPNAYIPFSGLKVINRRDAALLLAAWLPDVCKDPSFMPHSEGSLSHICTTCLSFENKRKAAVSMPPAPNAVGGSYQLCIDSHGIGQHNKGSHGVSCPDCSSYNNQTTTINIINWCTSSYYIKHEIGSLDAICSNCKNYAVATALKPAAITSGAALAACKHVVCTRTIKYDMGLGMVVTTCVDCGVELPW